MEDGKMVSYRLFTSETSLADAKEGVEEFEVREQTLFKDTPDCRCEGYRTVVSNIRVWAFLMNRVNQSGLPSRGDFAQAHTKLEKGRQR
jgi:hypothetical protein